MVPQGHPLPPWGDGHGGHSSVARKARREDWAAGAGRSLGGGMLPQAQAQHVRLPGPRVRVTDSPGSTGRPPPPHTELSCMSCLRPGLLTAAAAVGVLVRAWEGGLKTQSELCKHRAALGLAPPACVFLLPPTKALPQVPQWHLLCGSQGLPTARTLPALSPQAAPSPAPGRGPGGPSGSG